MRSERITVPLGGDVTKTAGLAVVVVVEDQERHRVGGAVVGRDVV